MLELYFPCLLLFHTMTQWIVNTSRIRVGHRNINLRCYWMIDRSRWSLEDKQFVEFDGNGERKMLTFGMFVSIFPALAWVIKKKKNHTVNADLFLLALQVSRAVGSLSGLYLMLTILCLNRNYYYVTIGKLPKERPIVIVRWKKYLRQTEIHSWKEFGPGWYLHDFKSALAIFGSSQIALLNERYVVSTVVSKHLHKRNCSPPCLSFCLCHAGTTLPACFHLPCRCSI